MIFAGDVIIKEAIEQGLDDMKKNPWLLNDVLSQFTGESALQNKYGKKEIDAAKEWFANNPIHVYLQHRLDKDALPAVTIGLGSSVEDPDMKTTADLSSEVETLMPGDIGKPIPYILKPFVPASYDEDNGIVGVPAEIDISMITPGMILVDPATGNGYEIEDVGPENTLKVQDGLDIDAAKLAVVPQFQIYRVRREHTFFKETYNIGCHVHGDPSTLLWLHAIVLYSLLRYRESLLEGRSFAQSLVASSDLIPNSTMSTPGGENFYSRYITLTGQVENSWLKSPKRIIESATFSTDPDKEGGFSGGIKILSQKAPSFLDNENEPWTTIDDEE